MTGPEGATGPQGDTGATGSQGATGASVDTEDFATAEQGALADSAVQPGDGTDQLNSAAYTGYLASASGTGLDEALAVLDGLDDDFAALEAADWTLLGITVTGDVTISTLETALGSEGVSAGLYLSLGLPSLVSAFVGFAALYPGGTVTGGDPGLYQWDGGNLNFVRAIEPGDKFITARACDEDFTTVGGHGPVAQTVTVNLGSGDETVIGSSVIGASVVEYDNSTSGLTAEQVQDAIDELADEKADGPASAMDSAIALFDGTEGKTLKDSAVAISTDGTLSSDSDSLVPTEQAVKEYVDANAGGGSIEPGNLVYLSANYGAVPGVNFTARGAAHVFVAGTMYYGCFTVSEPLTISVAKLVCFTESVGHSIRLGIYTADAEWKPTGLVSDIGTVDASTTGIKSLSGLSISLSPGRHLAAVISDGTPQTRTVAGVSNTVDLGDQLKPVGGLLLASSSYGALPSTGPDPTNQTRDDTGWYQTVFFEWEVD